MAQAGEYLPAVRVMLVSEPTDVPQAYASRIEDSIETGRHLIGDADRENLIALLVDPLGGVVAVHTVSVGTLTSAPCDVAALFRAAILANAAGFVLVHNHPSGGAGFSEADGRLWDTVAAAGRLLGIEALDSVIVTPHRGPATTMSRQALATRKARFEEARLEFRQRQEARRRILGRSDEERAAFVAAVVRGAEPDEAVPVGDTPPTWTTFQNLSRRLSRAGLALPASAREALGLAEGATYAKAARQLLKSWKGAQA